MVLANATNTSIMVRTLGIPSGKNHLYEMNGDVGWQGGSKV